MRFFGVYIHGYTLGDGMEGRTEPPYSKGISSWELLASLSAQWRCDRNHLVMFLDINCIRLLLGVGS